MVIDIWFRMSSNVDPVRRKIPHLLHFPGDCRTGESVNNFYFSTTTFCGINHKDHIMLWITLDALVQTMGNSLQKQAQSIHIPRMLTRAEIDTDQLIHFLDSGDGYDSPVIERPDGWSIEAAETFAEHAFCPAIPAERRLVEENTTPSWLWRHNAQTKNTVSESSVRQVFARTAGAATFAGWKEGLFATEEAARAFYDEARYALLQRFIALRPEQLATAGIEWAYGIKKAAPTSATTASSKEIVLSNSEMDALVSGCAKAPTRAKWQKLTTAQKGMTRTLRFSDTASEWEITEGDATQAFIDVLACRHNDGSINIEALRQRTKLIVLLLDLGGYAQDRLAIGVVNLAPLLLALALPYDSEAARTTAAALFAIITAEAYATSAQLAAMRGMGKTYPAHREKISRNLRNHHRAAHGDLNDYEKISILPAPLSLQHCPDLTLVAAAQNGWNNVIHSVQRHGLRHTQVTAATAVPTMALVMNATSNGIEPMRALTTISSDSEGNFRRDIHTSITEALTRLGYSATERQTIARHIIGHGTLKSAPSVNHASLRSAGFDEAAITRVEWYLNQVSDIRHACTPWIVGEDFCRTILKINARKLQSPHFDLLTHLGFDDAAVAAANAYCYGHNSVRTCTAIESRHRAVFATGLEVGAIARASMASSVQSFVSDDVSPKVSVANNASVSEQERFILNAWRSGLHSITFTFDAPANAPRRATTVKAKSLSPAAKSLVLKGRSAQMPARTSRPKAGQRMLSLTKGKTQPYQGIKRH